MYHEENILYIQAYYKVTERVLLHLWLLLLCLPDIDCCYIYLTLAVARPFSQGILTLAVTMLTVTVAVTFLDCCYAYHYSDCCYVYLTVTS